MIFIKKHLVCAQFIAFFLSAFLLPKIGNAQPKEVLLVLNKAGKNRVELEKAINYFKKSADPLKLKAVYFLIANMDIHQSENYYWADEAGKKVPYNELTYPSFDKAIEAFDAIRRKTKGIHPVAFSTKDEQQLKAAFLINNIESAFKVWKNSTTRNIPFKDFCEYILPYRASVEPLQNWRNTYQQKFNWMQQIFKTRSISDALNFVQADYKTWFKNDFGQSKRIEPLPRLGALQLLLRKQGPCEDIVDLQIFTLRSQGIPVAINIIPYWATTANSHFNNTVFAQDMKPIPYDVDKVPTNSPLVRAPSKVLRITHSKQTTTLASFTSLQNIPIGFMRSKNYLDVTNQFWTTKDLTLNLSDTSPQKIAYISVFNAMRWKPTWWGNVAQGKVIFKEMPTDVLYMPSYYINGKTEPAGYPVFHGNDQDVILKPDLSTKRTINIMEQAKYLIFRPGRIYRLYYWDNAWKALGIQKATSQAHSIKFNNVPNNALLLLVPEYSEGKERPFIITDDGNRQWF